MKKIKTSKQVEDEKKRRNNFIIGGVMIFLLVIAPLGYAILTGNRDNNSSGNVIEYNNIKFYRQGEYWALPQTSLNLNIQTNKDRIFYFKHLPQDVENISISSQLNIFKINKYSNQPLYFSSLINQNKSQNNEIAGKQEIVINLNDIVLRQQDACLNQSIIDDLNLSIKNNCSEELPVKTCDSNIIVFVSSDNMNNEEIYTNNNCVFINAQSPQDYGKKADLFLYKILEVI